MSRAAEILGEVHACGAMAYHRDGQVRIRPAGVLPPELMARVREHRGALVSLLRGDSPEPSASVALPAWVVPSHSDGTMRLCVETAPEDWPRDGVQRAAALVDRVDALHREGRDADAEASARELEKVLGELSRKGVRAYLAS